MESKPLRESTTMLQVTFGVGVVVAIVMQLANGWWLDAGNRIVPMPIAVAIGAAVAGAVGKADNWWRRVASYWVGLMIAWFAIVFVWGGSNIFPIVLAFAAVMSAIPLLAGAVVGLIVSMSRS